MRILLLTQLFQPEPNHLKGLAFAQELMRRGHEVEILTGYPNYPGGKIYTGYQMRRYEREQLQGVPVTRVALYPNHDRSGWRRCLSYSSFAISASLWGARQISKPDVVHVYQGPATIVAPAVRLRWRYGSPFVLDIQDLWPDSVAASGMLKVPGGLPLLHRWCRWTYQWASRIVVLSEGYRQTLVNRGVPGEKIDVVYNWSDESSLAAGALRSEARDTFGLGGRFNIVYAGNLGAVQALDHVVEAARLLQHELPHVRFIFVGDGVEAGRLKDLVAAMRLNNVQFLPRQSSERMGEILPFAGALLIHLIDTPLSRIGIPQKTQAYLAAGRPILAAVSGEAARLVKKSRAGVTAEPGDARSIAEGVRQLARLTPAERHQLGCRGREFYRHHLAFMPGVDRMEAVFQRVADEHAGQFLGRSAA